jgi:hypothetical protein
VVIMTTSSGPAHSVGTRLTRLALRLLLLAGCTAAAWLAGVLLAGSASADTGLPISINVPQLNVGQLSVPRVELNTAPAKKPAAKSTATKAASQDDQGLGGLVGGLLSTVTSTVNNVTTTVTNTVGTVTTVVSSTVNNVVTTVTTLPQHVLPPSGSNGGIGLPPLLPDSNDGTLVSPILKPAPSHTGSSATEAAQRSNDAPAAIAEAPEVAPAAVESTPAVEAEHPHVQPESRPLRPLTTREVRQAGNTHEKAAPADRGPNPMPTPTAPMTPVAPSSSFSSNNDGGAGARNALATLTSQTRLAPPPLLGRLDRQHPVAERGRTPGLPVTSPD